MAKPDLRKRPAEVAAMFDGVAGRYDFTNSVLSGGNAALWRIATVRAIDPGPGERVLDVACGTGTSSAAVARRGAAVVGLDFSAGMVEAARRRHPGIEFLVGDAEALPFGDEEFDAATVSFGLRNMANPHQALTELHRVLKPGGRIVVCEFSTPNRALVRAAYTAYLRQVLPRIARVTSSNPEAYEYLGESIEAWPDQVELSAWIRGAGFTRVAHRDLTGGIVALHRGLKPTDAKLLAAAKRKRKAQDR